MKRNVLKTIEETRKIVNQRYCMSHSDFEELINNSRNFVDLTFNSFLLGYSQGYKVAMKEHSH